MANAVQPEILHYTGYDSDRGGVMVVVRQIVNTSSYRCVVGVNPEFVQHAESRVETTPFPAIDAERISLGTIWRARTVAEEVRRWMRARPGHIVHVHSRAGLLVALWLHRWGERHVVVSVHCYGRRTWFYRWARRKFWGRWFWLSPAMKRHYGMPEMTWSECMPNGVLGPLPKETELLYAPRTPGRLRVGGAGALVGWKRWDVVLDALALLKDVSVEFVHIGGELDTPESRRCAAELREKTARLGLTDRVQWRGWQQDSSGMLAEVDVVVVSSDGEPFSMIALEALYAGLPVIATKGGGPEDFVQLGENGWLIRPGEPKLLAEKLRALLNTDTWRTLRLNARRLERFSMSRTLGPQWDEAYLRVLKLARDEAEFRRRQAEG